jgi:hypothetical protein
MLQSVRAQQPSRADPMLFGHQFAGSGNNSRLISLGTIHRRKITSKLLPAKYANKLLLEKCFDLEGIKTWS